MHRHSPFYRGDMLWAEPNLINASELMRKAYEDRNESFNKGKLARKTIEEKLDADLVANNFLRAIANILKHKRESQNN